MSVTLKFVHSSFLKDKPQQSREPGVVAVPILKDTKLPLTAYSEAENAHLKCMLKEPVLSSGSSSLEWFVYEPHVTLIDESGQEIVNYSPPPAISPVVDRKQDAEMPPKTKPKAGATITVPIYGVVRLNDPIVKGGNFTWAEATHNGTRIPETRQIAENIHLLAIQLQKCRDQLGMPIQIISWYRPPAINRAVGGASRSQHLYGSAVDISADGFTGRELAKRFSWWKGGVGIYKHLPRTLHLDIGVPRRWGF